jgi:hypothetical protein
MHVNLYLMMSVQVNPSFNKLIRYSAPFPARGTGNIVAEVELADEMEIKRERQKISLRMRKA